MQEQRAAYWTGFKVVSPLLLGIFPFAMVSGTTAMTAGLSIWAAFGLSFFVFAGASQLALVDLFSQQAPLLVLILTALVINTRFVIYSAGLAPHFKGLRPGNKALLAYLLTDQAYLLTADRYEKGSDKITGIWFYLGVASALWLVWQAGTAAGILLGSAAPESLGLDFAVPLSFIALLMPVLKNKPSAAAALVAGFTVYLAHDLPMNLGLLAATAAGITAGILAGRK